MFLIGGAIHCPQGHLIAHTFAVDVTEADACHGLQLLEICNHGAIRLMRLLLHQYEETAPVQVFILRCFVA